MSASCWPGELDANEALTVGTPDTDGSDPDLHLDVKVKQIFKVSEVRELRLPDSEDCIATLSTNSNSKYQDPGVFKFPRTTSFDGKKRIKVKNYNGGEESATCTNNEMVPTIIATWPQEGDTYQQSKDRGRRVDDCIEKIRNALKSEGI